MIRSSGRGDRDPAKAGKVESAVPLQRVGGGGTSRPLGLVLVTASILSALIWQPWTKGPPSRQISGAPSPRTFTDNPAPSSGPDVALLPSASFALDGPRPYLSLVDNEWTVVALLAPGAPASTEEPSIQHASAASATDGPLLVLQQGLDYSVRPLEGVREASLTCRTLAPSRDRTAVHLPSGRVAYLGITVPGTVPRASVTADILEFPTLSLRRVPSPVVQLSGMGVGRLYTVPSTGPGGAVFFAMAGPGVLPAATYQFDVDSPGIGGHRYLYACIGS